MNKSILEKLKDNYIFQLESILQFETDEKEKIRLSKWDGESMSSNVGIPLLTKFLHFLLEILTNCANFLLVITYTKIENIYAHLFTCKYE